MGLPSFFFIRVFSSFLEEYIFCETHTVGGTFFQYFSLYIFIFSWELCKFLRMFKYDVINPIQGWRGQVCPTPLENLLVNVILRYILVFITFGMV